MKLYVYVQEARGLLAKDLNGFSDPYVRLQLGKSKTRTRVIRKTLAPSWHEEFTFKVEDLSEELNISVWDEDRFFNDDFLGQVKVSVSTVMHAEKQTLPHTWFPLQARGNKSKTRACGEILLTLCLYGRENYNRFLHQDTGILKFSNLEHLSSRASMDAAENIVTNSNGSVSSFESTASSEASSMQEEKSSIQSLAARFYLLFVNKSPETDKSPETVTHLDKNSEEEELSETYGDCEGDLEEENSDCFFEEGFDGMESGEQEIPPPLPGGILLDQVYSISPQNLNAIIFRPNSQFMQDLATLQGTMNWVEGAWRKAGDEPMKRVVTYTKGATKLVKAVKATEEQTYLKADGKAFVVLLSVSTPDVPYGGSFRIELLFCITPGPELLSGEETSRLSVSWRINFLQSTIMKGMIEGGARQGLKDSYQQFSQLLSQHAKPLDLASLPAGQEQTKPDLHMQEPQSEWKLIVEYIGNFTVIFTLFLVAFFLLHIFLAMPTTVQGLEFGGLDLPDSIGEVLTCGFLVLQGERVLKMISHFMRVRFQKGGDHGLKAQGDGWLLTVALIEGQSLAAVDDTGYSDPYVIFTCNGKTKTSSIKLQTLNPQWHEIFEYDATEEPPSVMDVEAFDFEGPFAEATSLGHAEINFLKSSSEELADLWIPLKGRLAQACQSKLHLRIFLTHTKGPDVITQYITKMEKEVGKKIARRSPQTNSTFQKLFGLPEVEFLINDFSCYLKRKMPLQGRLFLSARMLGFYANLFGHKTKFSFLWEDIEEITELPPSLASMGSPSLVIFLRKGRGMDASHGAKYIDPKGRLKFHFQSFVSFNVACRTIMALWRNRALSLEQRMQIVEAEEPTDGRNFQREDSESFLGVEEANMTKVHSGTLSFSAESFMVLFDGGHLEQKIMEKSGCLNYRTVPWETSKPRVYQRQIYYKFNRHVSGFGIDVTCTQQKSMLDNGNGWVLDEVLALQGVPFGDHFQLQVRKEIENLYGESERCNFRVFVGIAWLKSTTFQNRITKNIFEKFTEHLKETICSVEKEILARKQQGLHT